MATAIFLTGFEHGAPMSTAGLITTVVGSPVVAAGARTDGPGAFVMQTDPAAAAEYVQYQFPIADRGLTNVARFYFRCLTSLPGARVTLYGARGNIDTTDVIGIFLNSSGQLEAGMYDSSATSYIVQTGLTITLGQWYCVDVRSVLVAATSHTIDWEVDEVAQTQIVVSGVVNMQEYRSVALGPWEVAATVSLEFDDWAVSGTGADYPFGPGGSVAVKASQSLPADHQGITLSQWAYSDNFGVSSTILPSLVETEVRSRIIDFDITTGVQTTTAGDAAGFCRWPLETAPFTTTPNGVVGYVYHREASAGVNNMTWRLGLGGNSTNIWSGSVSSTTFLFVPLTLARPGGGSYTNGDLAGMSLEADSTDGAPNIWLAYMLLEIDAPDEPAAGADPANFPPMIFGRGAA